MDEIDILFVSAERFRCNPQVGTPCRMEWESLARYLSRPSVGEAKGDAGAWSPGLYDGNIRRKSALVHVCALVLDVDENGDVDEAAQAVARYRAVVHETFSSTNDSPRCRIVLPLMETIDVSTYEALHRVVRDHLRNAGLPPDEGAKDASRLSFAPVRRPGAGYRVRVLEGALLDARRVLDAQPPPPTPSLQAARYPATSDGRYLHTALRNAFEEVAHAGDGARNATLNRVTYGLARLDIDAATIEQVMIRAGRAAGLSPHEAERTVASALRARGRAA